MSCNNDEGLWTHTLEDDIEIDISRCILNEGSESEGFPFVFYDETTPVKDCSDLVIDDIKAYNKIKEGLMGESLLQVKRRRTLQFKSDVLDAPFRNEVMPQKFLRSRYLQSIDESVSELPQWVSSFTENSFEALDYSAEEWVAKCFNDVEMNLSCEESHTSGSPGASVCQVSELDNSPYSSEANVVQDQLVQRRQDVMFKGRKSYTCAPSKSPASVVYPFDIIKPCGVHGDTTLKDINQKIHTPPPPKPMLRDEHVSVCYPKSAFSGKPVVGKTKICTEGGKGSITIMRTKG
ncbi:hypothetical protein LIER_11563 [Lithospermum erythrorhizon]|uniref:Protein XRI1 n=1 Tax=Lithospermum erythrorhizon TaxID=34254 RepID=A0AAV3PQ34_LITER